MIRVKLDDVTVERGRRRGRIRSASMGHANTRNSKNYFNGRPPSFRHEVGAVGEFAYAQEFGFDVDETTVGRGDDGIDFPDGSQLKTPCQPRTPRLFIGVDRHKQLLREVELHERTLPTRYVLAWMRPDEWNVVDIIGSIEYGRWLDVRTVIQMRGKYVYSVNTWELDAMNRQASMF